MILTFQIAHTSVVLHKNKKHWLYTTKGSHLTAGGTRNQATCLCAQGGAGDRGMGQLTGDLLLLPAGSATTFKIRPLPPNAAGFILWLRACAYAVSPHVSDHHHIITLSFGGATAVRGR